tara:strand:+ start:11305 stop:12147 length:843 start_codon:yes stop_codon:yes gene_type:complete
MADNLEQVAKLESEGDIQRVQAQTRANRISSTDPFGTQTYNEYLEQDPGGGPAISRWTSDYALNEPLGQTLESMQNVGAGRANLAEGSMARYWDEMQNPMDFDQYGDPVQMADSRDVGEFSFDPMGRQKAEDAAYERSTARLDPQFSSRQNSMELKLRNQGLSPGDQAYDAAMSNLGRERTDAYEMARLGSVAEGRTDVAQDYGQALGTSQQQAALGGQEFGQNFQQANLANALRGTARGEGMQERGYYLNEANQQLQGVNVPGVPEQATQGQNMTLEQG